MFLLSDLKLPPGARLCHRASPATFGEQLPWPATFGGQRLTKSFPVFSGFGISQLKAPPAKTYWPWGDGWPFAVFSGWVFQGVLRKTNKLVFRPFRSTPPIPFLYDESQKQRSPKPIENLKINLEVVDGSPRWALSPLGVWRVRRHCRGA